MPGHMSDPLRMRHGEPGQAVDRHHAVPLRSNGNRVYFRLENAIQRSTAGESSNRRRQGVEIPLRSSAIPCADPKPAYVRDHLSRFVYADRRPPNDDVIIDFGEDTADPQCDERADRGLPFEADDGLLNWRDLLLDQDLINACVGAILPRRPQHRRDHATDVGRSAITSVRVSSTKCAAAPSSHAMPPGRVPSSISWWYSRRLLDSGV